MVPFLTALIYFFLLIMSCFLICLVLIQRGKGGGLAGALGGVGGSSAFGSKAGDVFTRVTMISAGIWIALNMVLVILSNQRGSAWGDTPTPGSASQSTFTPSKGDSTDKSKGPAGLDSLPPPSVPPLSSKGETVVPATKPNANGPSTGTGSEMPSPFLNEPLVPSSPLPAGSTPSGGGNNPKP